MADVVLSQVCKRFASAQRPSVDHIDLQIAHGEFMVLVGPSGCGKSTTLRMIAGLEPITSGEIQIGGRRVNDLAPKHRDIAMVFQNYALYPHMTVYKNMAFGLMMAKVPKPEIDRRVREAAEILGMGDLLERKPAALSGGQRQRVAVGRAIVRKPAVFLFDEPLSNLDAKMRVQMRAELTRLHERLGATMIYVTHDQVEAMTMGDRITVMEGGRIQQVDQPLALYDRPANQFVAGFIGSPQMNFFPGELITENDTLVFQQTAGPLRFALTAQQRADLPVPGDGPVGITLGLRPEVFRTGEAGPATLQAKVELVEPMGAETYLTLSAGPTTFIARVENHVMPRHGDTITLSFDPMRAHLFDLQSQARLI
jgi:multiple sugar transport system ATP-binding protein